MTRARPPLRLGHVGLGAAASRNRKEFRLLLLISTPFPDGSLYAGWGASHFAELWYVFDRLDQSPWNWTAADRKLAEEMSAFWVNFARSGDPNGTGLPSWPAFTSVESKVEYLADPITGGGVANIHGLSAFDAVYSTVGGKPFAAR